MFMDCKRKQTHQCGLHKLKTCLQNLTAEKLRQALFKKNIKFLGFHAVVGTCEDVFIYVSFTTVGVGLIILMKLG